MTWTDAKTIKVFFLPYWSLIHPLVTLPKPAPAKKQDSTTLPKYNRSHTMLHSETIVLPIKLISYSHDLHSISSSLEAFVKKSVKLKASSCSYGALIIVQWSFGCVKLRHRSTDIVFRWSGRAHQRSLSAACNKMCENLKELLNGSFEFVVWETLNESVESSFVNLIHSFTCDESFIFFSWNSRMNFFVSRLRSHNAHRLIC